jgi:hypothetical protein
VRKQNQSYIHKSFKALDMKNLLLLIFVLTILECSQTAETPSLVKVSHTKDKLALEQLLTDTIINTLKIDSHNAIIQQNYKLVAPDNQTINKTYVKGLIDYRKYDTMKMDTSYSFNVTISKNISRETIKAAISSFTNHPVQRETIRISKVMTALLVSDDSSFTIKLLNGHPEQIVEMTDSTYTEWDWSVIAKQAGKHKLKMYVSILDSGMYKDFPVYEGEVFIFVKGKFWKSVGKFINDNKQWLWTGVILPFLPLLWKKLKAWWRKRKKGFRH